jgi:hypothetical protein
MRVRYTGLALFFVLGLVDSPRADAQCAGFVDISSFGGCPDILWLKNRQVTLGCSPTHYCPNDAVGRLQMAAFMNRVGNVLTPTVFSVEESGGTLDVNLTHYLCQSGVLPPRNYAREVTGDASLSFEVTGQRDVGFSIVRSIDGGATWQPFGSNHDFPVVPRGTVGVRQHAHASAWTQYGPHPTFAYQYAVRVGGPAGSVNTISSWTCHLQVTVTHSPG